MKPQLAGVLIAVAWALGGLGMDRAEAQVMPGTFPTVDWIGPEVTVPSVEGMSWIDSGPTFPYSYYAAFPNRARQYVPYGSFDQFPFYGTPYGQPYDRWTWETMSGSSNGLARYYYPPVR